jgi:hypothetical protein
LILLLAGWAGSAAVPETCRDDVDHIPADNPCIRYHGRFDHANPHAPAFSWPGVVIEARFRGTSVAARLQAQGTYFDVYIDGRQVFPQGGGIQGTASLFVNGQGDFLLAQGLRAGEHSLRIEKRSETHSSVCAFRGLALDPDMGLLPLPRRASRRIEFIGDSYTVGYGNESPSRIDPGIQDIQDESGRACSDGELAAYTNTQKTYAVLAAKAFGAEYQVNAFSGLGLARHFNGGSDFLPFQDYYERSVHADPQSAPWKPGGWIPKVVVIGLGANDFSTPLSAYEEFATREELHRTFREKYVSFLKSLRMRYHGAKFILMAASLPPDDEMKTQVKLVIESEKAAGRKDLHYFEFDNATGYGCAWHPDRAAHRKGAEDLARLISGATGWRPRKALKNRPAPGKAPILVTPAPSAEPEVPVDSATPSLPASP